VLQDEGNPRALAYQLVALERLVTVMPKGELAVGRTPAEKLVLKTLTGVRLAELDTLVQPDPQTQRRVSLEKVLEALESDLAAISNALTAQYFRHEEQPHSLLRRIGVVK